MTLSDRKHSKYNPWSDARERHPNWKLTFKELLFGEQLILPGRKRIIIHSEAEDVDMSAAVAVAHLDLDHHLCDGYLTDDQQRQAEWLAKIRVNDPAYVFPDLDGEPSVPVSELDGSSAP